MNASTKEIERRTIAANATRLYTNETIEETATTRLTAFTHKNNTRWTVFVKPNESCQWKTVAMGHDEQKIRKIYSDMVAGRPLSRLS